MRKILYVAGALFILFLFGCNNSKSGYVISGTTSKSRLEGQKVYLVPYGSPSIKDSLGVDSTVIRNGKFEFRGNKGEFMARLTVDMRLRYGIQEILVVTQPGTVNVVLDSVSSATGTPQNDGLQRWKELKEDHDRVHWNQTQHIKYLREQGDTVYANSLADSLRQFNDGYLREIHSVMRGMGEGPGFDFMRQRYGDPD